MFEKCSAACRRDGGPASGALYSVPTAYRPAPRGACRSGQHEALPRQRAGEAPFARRSRQALHRPDYPVGKAGYAPRMSSASAPRLASEATRSPGTAAARRADRAGLDPDMVIERSDTTVGVGKTFLAYPLGHLARRGACSSSTTLPSNR
jgi:hypothetical protein